LQQAPAWWCPAESLLRTGKASILGRGKKEKNLERTRSVYGRDSELGGQAVSLPEEGFCREGGGQIEKTNQKDNIHWVREVKQ